MQSISSVLATSHYASKRQRMCCLAPPHHFALRLLKNDLSSSFVISNQETETVLSTLFLRWYPFYMWIQSPTVIGPFRLPVASLCRSQCGDICKLGKTTQGHISRQCRKWDLNVVPLDSESHACTHLHAASIALVNCRHQEVSNMCREWMPVFLTFTSITFP